MGEAKRRALAREQEKAAIARADIPRLAAAMRKLATAASTHVGTDCYTHAAIAQAILARLGVEAKLVIGYAAWRVGNGDGDVILHAPVSGMVYQGENALPYHVWLLLGNNILDLTTYQLRTKAQQMDALDGGRTTVEWCPEYLFAPKESVSSIQDVTNLGPGLYYYSQEPAVAARVMSASHDPAEEDVNIAWLIYQNQDIRVIGPNDMQL